MRRKALMVLFAVGAIAGFGSAAFGCRHHASDRREAFEDHIAEICTRAGERGAARAGGHPEKTP